MKIVCISDTHEHHDKLEIPACDLLLHAGDFTMVGERRPVQLFNEWLGKLLRSGVVKKAVIIAGNHDFLFQNYPEDARGYITAAEYLEDSATEIEGIKIWGTPYQPWFNDWAFNIRTEEELGEHFKKIPAGLDILLTHGPPYKILDTTNRGQQVGSSALSEAISRVKPKLVVFGHIHEAYGMLTADGITYVNASNCDARYQLKNSPIVIDW